MANLKHGHAICIIITPHGSSYKLQIFVFPSPPPSYIYTKDDGMRLDWPRLVRVSMTRGGTNITHATVQQYNGQNVELRLQVSISHQITNHQFAGWCRVSAVGRENEFVEMKKLGRTLIPPRFKQNSKFEIRMIRVHILFRRNLFTSSNNEMARFVPYSIRNAVH